MTTIKIENLNEESAEAQSMTLEEAALVVGGATAKPVPKPKPAPEPYLKYELENVLISSYS